MTAIDQHTVILVWYQKVEEVFRPLKINDFVKAILKIVNDKFT